MKKEEKQIEILLQRQEEFKFNFQTFTTWFLFITGALLAAYVPIMLFSIGILYNNYFIAGVLTFSISTGLFLILFIFNLLGFMKKKKIIQIDYHQNVLKIVNLYKKMGIDPKEIP